MKFSILIIDDEKSQREPLAGFLSKQGYEVIAADSCDSGMEVLRINHIGLIISDFKMPGKTGLDVINEAMQINPEVPVIISTAYGEIEGAVDLMKHGAKDYIQKPIDLEELLSKIKKYRDNYFNRLDAVSINRTIESKSDKVSFGNIISNDPKISELLSLSKRVASSKASVMIRGESGTGKELIARAIHDSSDRSQKPFVVVNCAAMPESLFESELFGHEKGAFTGAIKQKSGKFELADCGTLFIDEVGDIPLQIQVKLLRAIQFGQIERLGSENTMHLDVRIISATHKNLEEMIAINEFREDLFYRMNVVEITLPPLRDRKNDIPLLAEYFVGKFQSEINKKMLGVTPLALDKLMKYDFPGNIRQLENIIHRAMVISRSNYIELDDLPIEVAGIVNNPSDDDSELLQLGDLNSKVVALESILIRKALVASNGNQTKAANLLNISERTLRYKLNKYEIDN